MTFLNPVIAASLAVVMHSPARVSPEVFQRLATEDAELRAGAERREADEAKWRNICQ